MSNAPINIMVTRIKECLENANKPMTAKQIADELMVVSHTVRNHMSMAIKLGYARETPFKVGKASTYEATNKKTNFLPAVAMPNGETRLIRDLFTQWSKNPPQTVYSKIVFRLITQLYKSVLEFTDSDNPLHQQHKIQILKGIHVAVNKERERLKNTLAILDALHSNEKLWDPKDMTKQLLILDHEMEPEMIRSYIDMQEGTN